MRNKDHPVWDVYDLHRTARLNVKYFTDDLNTVKRENLIIEIILAFTVPSSAIAGFWFWDNPIGKDVWKYLIGLSAVLAVIKPFLGLPEKIRHIEEVLTGFRSLGHDLTKLTVSISQDQKYTSKHRVKLEEALDRKGILVQKAPKTKENKKKVKKYQIEVEKELPSANYFIPKGGNKNGKE